MLVCGDEYVASTRRCVSCLSSCVSACVDYASVYLFVNDLGRERLRLATTRESCVTTS